MSDKPKLAFKIVRKTRAQMAGELHTTVKEVAKWERQLARQGNAYRSEDGKELYVRMQDLDPLFP